MWHGISFDGMCGIVCDVKCVVAWNVKVCDVFRLCGMVRCVM